MKNHAKLFCAAAAAAAVPVFLLAPGHASRRQKAPFLGMNFAHRGLHSRDKSVPENSIAAFRLAARAGYGVELDVQLTRDKQIVVFHDDTLLRACGVDARVDDYRWQELCEKMRLFGTEHTIPLFSQVLSVVRSQVPLIVELKTGGDWQGLCARVRDMLRSYEGPYCIESFDPHIVRWFYRNAPEILRGQLSEQSIHLPWLSAS